MYRNHAVQLAKLKLKVFPCVAGDKRPCIKTGFKGASSDPLKVEEMFKLYPNANIGLVTGKDNGFFVVDIDCKNGALGYQSWDKLTSLHGDIKIAPMAKTWSGGRHIFIAYPEEGDVKCRTGIEPGLDIKGEGGYVIASPSVVNGEPYEWLKDLELWSTPLPLAPDWLLNLLGQPNAPQAIQPDQPIVKTRRHTSLVSFAGTLRAQGVSEEHIYALISERNKTQCQPPLEDDEVRGIAKGVAKYSPNRPVKDSFNPNLVATQILREHNLLFCDDIFYEYNCTLYKYVEHTYIQKLVKKFLGASNCVHKNHEVIQSLTIDTAISNKEMNKSQLLNIKNGMLDIETMQMHPHDPSMYSTIQLPVEYNPEATCPLWCQTLDQIFGDKPEEEATQCINTIKEFFGLCLTKYVKFDKALFLLGEGRNGKSTMLYVLEKILGDENYSAITLESLGKPNYISEIFGKLANISIETNAKTSMYDATFKAIVSGDVQTADRKYGHPFKFHPFCKMIFTLNNMPQVNDKTDAFFKRLVIIKITKQFTEKDQDKELRFKLLTEINGIFTWMVNGYKRLAERGYFDLSGHLEKETDEYRIENNSILGFVDEECVIDKNAIITKTTLYDRYSRWCKDSGMHPVSKKKFGTQLIKAYYLGKEDTTYGGAIRIWKGIRTTSTDPRMIYDVTSPSIQFEED